MGAGSMPTEVPWFPLIHQFRRVAANTDRYRWTVAYICWRADSGWHSRLATLSSCFSISINTSGSPRRLRPFGNAPTSLLRQRASSGEPGKRGGNVLFGENTAHLPSPRILLLPGTCGSVLTYQTMLRNTNKDEGWGEVDLLGLRPITLTPVVVEVKDARGSDTPLRGIVEGAAYAVALRKAWPHRLRTDWLQVLSRRLGPDLAEQINAIPATLDEITVVMAAPEAVLGETYRRSTDAHERPGTARRLAGAPRVDIGARRTRHSHCVCKLAGGSAAKWRQTPAGSRPAAAAAQ